MIMTWEGDFTEAIRSARSAADKLTAVAEVSRPQSVQRLATLQGVLRSVADELWYLYREEQAATRDIRAITDSPTQIRKDDA